MSVREVCAGEVPQVAPVRRSNAAPLWLVLAAFAAVYVIWGSTYLGISLAIETMPPLMMGGARFFTAGLLLYAVMRWKGAPRPDRVHWKNSTIIGALLLLGGNGLVTWGQQTVPSGIAALMVALVPLWMIVMEWLGPGGSRPRGTVFTGIALGFVGVGLIVLGKDQAGKAVVDPAGAAALLLAPISWAIGSLLSRRVAQSGSALQNIGMQMIGGGGLMLLVGAAMGELGGFDPMAISMRSGMAFLYLTLIGSLVGFTAYVWLLQVSTPARVSSYAYVNPLIAVILGRVILSEPLPRNVVLAAVLIIGAVVLITTAKARAAKG